MILDEDGKAKPGIKYKAYRTPVLGKTPRHRTVGGVLGHFPKAIITRELGHAFPRQFRNPEIDRRDMREFVLLLACTEDSPNCDGALSLGIS